MNCSSFPIPALCSGNGECTVDRLCQCNDGWTSIGDFMPADGIDCDINIIVIRLMWVPTLLVSLMGLFAGCIFISKMFRKSSNVTERLLRKRQRQEMMQRRQEQMKQQSKEVEGVGEGNNDGASGSKGGRRRCCVGRNQIEAMIFCSCCWESQSLATIKRGWGLFWTSKAFRAEVLVLCALVCISQFALLKIIDPINFGVGLNGFTTFVFAAQTMCFWFATPDYLSAVLDILVRHSMIKSPEERNSMKLIKRIEMIAHPILNFISFVAACAPCAYFFDDSPDTMYYAALVHYYCTGTLLFVMPAAICPFSLRILIKDFNSVIDENHREQSMYSTREENRSLPPLHPSSVRSVQSENDPSTSMSPTSTSNPSTSNLEAAKLVNPTLVNQLHEAEKIQMMARQQQSLRSTVVKLKQFQNILIQFGFQNSFMAFLFASWYFLTRKLAYQLPVAWIGVGVVNIFFFRSSGLASSVMSNSSSAAASSALMSNPRQ